MPKVSKTLLDEARQVLQAQSKAGDRMWRRNRNIEDLYRRYQSETEHEYPMYELTSNYHWLDERDAAMDAYYQARKLYEALDNRRRDIEDAMSRMNYRKRELRNNLDRLLREQEEWRQDDALRQRNPRFYEMKGRFFEYKIPKAKEAIDNFEIPPAGWRGY